MTHVLRCRADFADRTDAEGKEVLESTVLMPAVCWNERGIKWFDDNKLVKEAKC